MSAERRADATQPAPSPDPSNPIDEQIAGEHGTTLVPDPGAEAAPDSPSEPRDGVEVDEDQGVVTRREESSVGPGAGESAVVRVTMPIQREDDKATRTRHPTLRDTSPESRGR